MKGKSDFVEIQVTIDQEKNIDYLKSFFFGHFEAHLGNLKFLLDQSCVCIYVLIYPIVRYIYVFNIFTHRVKVYNEFFSICST